MGKRNGDASIFKKNALFSKIETSPFSLGAPLRRIKRERATD
jgi:hypothetical protein